MKNEELWIDKQKTKSEKLEQAEHPTRNKEQQTRNNEQQTKNKEQRTPNRRRHHLLPAQSGEVAPARTWIFR